METEYMAYAYHDDSLLMTYVGITGVNYAERMKRHGFDESKITVLAKDVSYRKAQRVARRWMRRNGNG